MNLTLKKSSLINGQVNLSGSKSISNRVLIIRALGQLKFETQNLSESDDTKHLQLALENIQNSSTNNIQTINVGHAGTDMRFLTALLAITNGDVFLTGSERLQQRPIAPLVDALQQLGADVKYQNKQGYPPLQIKGKELMGGKLSIASNISSQFISALLLIAPYLKNGLKLELNNERVSVPYIKMTIATMQRFGAEVFWNNNTINVKAIPYVFKMPVFNIEGDWSSASYYYSLIALSDIGTGLTLTALEKNSLQADALCATIYEHFGVDTIFEIGQISIIKKREHKHTKLIVDFLNCPDIAQTVACTCLGLNISFDFTGLQTLKVKETDRITALQQEFLKFNKTVLATENRLLFDADKNPESSKDPIIIDTYNDHRMAMAFAPLCLVYKTIQINNAEVVSKSYPNFWEDLVQIGIAIS